MHSHGNQENLFDRVDFKPSELDTMTLNLGFTRSWFQTPNSFDAQGATAWSGLVVDNGGTGPERCSGRLAGSAFADQNLQHGAKLDATDQCKHGVHVGRLRAAGSIQLLSEPQPFRRFDAGPSAADSRSGSPAHERGTARRTILRQGHSQHVKAGVTYEAHHS